MNYLAEVNVGIALAVIGHVHHAIALRWFEESQTSQILFSRVTQMGLLRLLKNRKLMGANVKTSCAGREEAKSIPAHSLRVHVHC